MASFLPKKRGAGASLLLQSLPCQRLRSLSGLERVTTTQVGGSWETLELPPDVVPELAPIGTHNGHFHCDEALACGLLRLLPAYANRKVLRTRNPELLERCHTVVDVGGVFDNEKRRFDHHQRGFEEFFPERSVSKLSSAGLVYKYYGKEVIQTLAAEFKVPLSTDIVDKLFTKMYTGFIESIDALDNGVDPFTGDITVPTHLGARVGQLNPNWNDDESTTEDEMDAFLSAMTLTTSEFTQALYNLCTVWLPARQLVETAVAKRVEVHASGQVICLERACPWKAHLESLEQEQSLPDKILFAIYPDSSGNWRVQCVSVAPGSFENRLSLLPRLQGLRDDALSTASGIPDCIFVHANGFIGGAKTYEGALGLAKISIAEQA